MISRDVRELLASARRHRERDRVRQAVDAYRQALQSNPDDRDVFFELASYLVEADRRELARELLDQAIERWPGDARAWRIRGEAWLIDGEAARAIPDFAEACRLGDEGAHARLARARGGEPLVLPGVTPVLAWRAGSTLLIAAVSRRVVLEGDLSPAYADHRSLDDDAMCRSKDLVRRGEVAAAMDLLADASARCPRDPRLQVRRGLLSFSAGDDAGAVAALRRGPEEILATAQACLGEPSGGTLATRGLGHLRGGRLDHAERDLDLALRKSAAPTTLLLRGYVLHARGRPDDAADDYAAASRKVGSMQGDPRMALVVRGAASLGLARLGRASFAEAGRAFEELGWAPGVEEAERP